MEFPSLQQGAGRFEDCPIATAHVEQPAMKRKLRLNLFERMPGARARQQPLREDHLFVAFCQMVRSVVSIDFSNGRKGCSIVVLLQMTAARANVDGRL